MDGLGEVVPRNYTLVAEMINARNNTLVDSCEDGHRQVASIGRCAYLVEDNTQLRLLVTQTNHSLYKVVAKGRVQPRCANNHTLLAAIQHSLFASQLGAAVGAVRTNSIGLNIRTMICSVEHVVGRNLYHPSSALFDGFSQIFRCCSVKLHAQLLVLLGLVNSSIGGAVHDAVNLVFLNKSVNGFLVCYVQFCHICIKIGMLEILLLQQLHLVSKLAVTACNKYLHLIRISILLLYPSCSNQRACR